MTDTPTKYRIRRGVPGKWYFDTFNASGNPTPDYDQGPFDTIGEAEKVAESSGLADWDRG